MLQGVDCSISDGCPRNRASGGPERLGIGPTVTDASNVLASSGRLPRILRLAPPTFGIPMALPGRREEPTRNEPYRVSETPEVASLTDVDSDSAKWVDQA